MRGKFLGPVAGDGATAVAWTDDEDFDEATIRELGAQSGMPPELAAALLYELENDET
jgi:hypothetical protein